MLYTSPLVTIGIAIYNGAEHLIETLESINQQTYNNIEIIIVDDGSKDNSYELCSNWAPASRFPISILKNTTNLGLPATRNVLLNKATGKYLSLFDQDDIMLAGKVESDVLLFEQQSEKVALVYSKLKLINEKGELLDQEYFERIGFKGVKEHDVFLELTKSNFIPAPTVMVRADCIRKIGGYDETLEFDDWDMWLRLSNKYDFVFSDIANAQYRIHNKSMMANKNKKQTIRRNQANIKMFQKHLGHDKKHNEALYKKLKELTIYSYFLGDEAAKNILYNYLKRRFDAKIWLYHKLALLGIKHF